MPWKYTNTVAIITFAVLVKLAKLWIFKRLDDLPSEDSPRVEQVAERLQRSALLTVSLELIDAASSNST